MKAATESKPKPKASPRLYSQRSNRMGGVQQDAARLLRASERGAVEAPPKLVRLLEAASIAEPYTNPSFSVRSARMRAIGYARVSTEDKADPASAWRASAGRFARLPKSAAGSSWRYMKTWECPVRR